MTEKARTGANTLGRLSEVLFEELERLNSIDPGDRDAIDAEIKRSKAVQGVAREINESAKTVLDTARLRAEWAGAKTAATPKLLEG